MPGGGTFGMPAQRDSEFWQKNLSLGLMAPPPFDWNALSLDGFLP